MSEKMNEQEFNALVEKLEEKTGAKITEAVKAQMKSIEGILDLDVNAVKSIIDNSQKAQDELESLKQAVKDQGLEITKLKEVETLSPKTIEGEVKSFIRDNFSKIKELKSQGHGVIELEIKAVGDITTASGTNPDGIPDLVGSQIAPVGNVNLRGDNITPLTTNINTSLAAYPYTETVPKDGDYSFVSEGGVKPQIDFKWETRYASPVKVAAWERLTEESIQDVVGLQSVATDYLRKKHDLKKKNGILFGDGVSPNPKGATTYGRLFVAGSMATSVVNPNIMDVINACVTDVYTTHNYQDEMSYMPSLVVMNPIDFFLNFTAAKDNDGKPLYPTATLFNIVNIGGMTVIPERDIPAGKIFVCDMSKYNTTNYMSYVVKIGWINDDFIKNQFVILGESRFHAFVKKLDEQAFIYDDIATIKAAITAP